jgi:hypothetical protein
MTEHESSASCDPMQDRIEAAIIAEELNCIPVFAKPDELQLDFDSSINPNDFYWEHLSLLHDCFQVLLGLPIFTKSKSGNWHARIKLSKELSDCERIALQLLLGSDPAREGNNLARWFAQGDARCCLFVPKPKLLPSADSKGLL